MLSAVQLHELARRPRQGLRRGKAAGKCFPLPSTTPEYRFPLTAVDFLVVIHCSAAATTSSLPGQVRMPCSPLSLSISPDSDNLDPVILLSSRGIVKVGVSFAKFLMVSSICTATRAIVRRGRIFVFVG